MRKVKQRSVKMLWIDEYYDGPLKGFCEYKRKKYYFKINGSWSYVLHPLLPATWEAHLAKHYDFVEHVGSHHDSVDGKHRNYDGKLQPEAEWHKFYDKYKTLTIPDADELPAVFSYDIGDSSTWKYDRRKCRLEILREKKAEKKGNK